MYDDIADVNKRLYNGNISQTSWNTLNTDSSTKTYTYTYDALNRITSATDNTGHYNLTSVSYDKNGNILSLNRKGHLNSTATSFGVMDNLVYTYDSGNKLKKVLDNGNDNYGFKDGANLTTEYTYDQNGNMKTDANKGITSILYNHLNLPTEIKFNNSNTKKINYTYDASGTKLRKVTNDNGNITTTDYAGSYIYENNILKQISQPEGYIESSGNNFQYVYQYLDQVRNVRLSYSDLDGNGSISQNEILQERNYYPFGLQHKGYNNQINGAINNYKQYQYQEFTEDLGLNTHEWKYRFSDPAIGRFWSIDPLVDDYRYQSPYNFSENRVIDGVELEGLEYVTVQHIMNGSTHISTTSTDYYRMSDKKINAINGTPAGTYNAASYGPEGKGVKHITHDISNNSITVRWDNRRVDFESRAGNHGLYSGPGSITGYGGKQDYDFNYQPVDWSDAIAKRHDEDYEDAIKNGGDFTGYIDDTRTYQADLDMLDRLDTFTNGGKLEGVDTPYRTSTSGEMELSIKGQKTVIGALAAYKKWKIDNGYDKDDSFNTLGQKFYKADKINAIIIGLLYDNKEDK
jgi:YD repeat-containing protein